MYNDDPRMVGPIVGECSVLGPNGDNGPDGINGLYPHKKYQATLPLAEWISTCFGSKTTQVRSLWGRVKITLPHRCPPHHANHP